MALPRLDPITLIEGDARTLPLPSGSVHCIITSPPYWGLRDYGLQATEWPAGGEAIPCEHVWEPCGVLKKRGQPTASSLAVEKGPARIKTALQGDFCLACGCWKGVLGLEPEPQLYIDHLMEIFDECYRVLRDDGTCWVNIGDCYDSRTKQRWLIPHLLALAFQSRGWIVRSDIIWAKGISFCESYAGSVMPESVRDRPTCSHEHILFLTKRSRGYYYDHEAVREAGRVAAGTLAAKGSGDRQGNRRGPAYALYDGKRNLRDVWAINTRPFKEAHFATFPVTLVEPLVRAGSPPFCCAECGEGARHTVERSPVPADIREQLENARTRSQTATGRSDGHTSYKPSKGYQREILADYYHLQCAHAPLRVEEVLGGLHGQPGRPHVEVGEGPKHAATVLDPFCGSGTVGLVCQQQGRNFIGIDANAEYLALAERRLLPRRPEAPAENVLTA